MCCCLIAISGCTEKSQPASAEPTFLLTTSEGLQQVTGSDRRLLISSNNGSTLLDPAVSPDGKTIAFTRQAPAVRDQRGNIDFGADLMLARRDGTEVREVLHHAAIGEFIRYPTFSKSGELFISVHGRARDGTADFHIDKFNPKTGERVRLIDHASGSALTADERTLAYVSEDRETQDESIISRDLRTARESVLVASSEGLVLLQSLVWAPDGKTLAFAASNPVTGVGKALGLAAHPTLQDLWLVNADGSGLHRLAELVESNPSIAWSADSSSIYVMSGGGFARFDVATGSRQDLGEGVPSGQIVRLP
jgi:Tol biopolymer transport system component